MPKLKHERMCATCEFCDTNDPPDGYYGTCHESRPLIARQPEPTGTKHKSVFPPVNKGDWCGKWELKVL